MVEKKLWKQAQVNGCFKHVDLKTLFSMSLSRFRGIKACMPAAFTPNIETKAPVGKTWCSIQEYTPTTDEWEPVQSIVNDFNENRRKYFRPSNQKIADESMSGYKPRQTKTGNLPSISNQPRKPVKLGIEFKNVACEASGVILYLEVVRSKVSYIYLLLLRFECCLSI